MVSRWEESWQAEQVFDNNSTYTGQTGGEAASRHYPYPNLYVEHELNGELASRVRRALEVENEFEPVFIVEVTKYEGYSEVTQEHLYWKEIRCGDKVHASEHSTEREEWKVNDFVSLLRWLDEKAPLE